MLLFNHLPVEYPCTVTYFNTSNVTIQLYPGLGGYVSSSYFNTSNVTIQQSVDRVLDFIRRFQYI